MVNEEKVEQLIQEIYQILQEERSKKNVLRICEIYDYATKNCGITRKLMELCRDVLMIWKVGESRFVPETIHQALCQVPDTYYDFIYGMEQNLKRRKHLQERLMNYLQTHKDVTSSEAILYISILNINKEIEEERVCRFIRLWKMHQMKNKETIRPDGCFSIENRDWITSRVILEGNPYVLRTRKNLALLDFQNQCMGMGFLIPYDKKTVCIRSMFLKNEDVSAKKMILSYLENFAKHAGITKILVSDLIFGYDAFFFQRNGYQLSSVKQYPMSGAKEVLCKQL